MNAENFTISIIIPVLNEAKTIASTLSHIQNHDNVEVIIADGGSQDETISIAQSFPVKIITTLPGRAKQMNAGAQVATGSILLFLHADTLLPVGFETLVRTTLLRPIGTQGECPVAGAFQLKIVPPMPGLWLIEKGVNWRSHFLQLPYGDQAIFLKADQFWQMGGFPEIPIMEDFELIIRLRKKGKIAIVPIPVLTSSRRWQKLGLWRTTLINQIIIIAYRSGIDPAQIVQWYRRQ